MPDNLAQRLTDELTQRDIDLLRLEAQNERDIEAAIALITAELIRRLIRSDPTAVGPRFGQVRLETLITEARIVIREAYREIYADVRRGFIALLRDERDILPEAVADSIGVSRSLAATLVGIRLATDVLRDIIDNRVFIVKVSEGETLRGFFERQAAAHQRRLSGVLRLGFAQNQSLNQLIGSLQGTTSISAREAATITRTAQNHIINQLRLETVINNSDIFRGVIWISILDSKTSYICIGRSRGQWDLSTGNPLPSSPVQYSFPGPPPAHGNCRSKLYPLTRTEAFIGREGSREIREILNSLTDEQKELFTADPPADETYTQWLRRQSVSVQNRVLGPARRKLWLDGDLDLTRLVTQRGRPLRLDELRQRRQRRVIT